MASDGEPRKFFSEAPSRPLKSHFGEQKASTSVLRMTCCNHGLMGDFMGAFYRPLVPSQTRCFVGAATSFRGPGPLGLPRNSNTDQHYASISAGYTEADENVCRLTGFPAGR